MVSIVSYDNCVCNLISHLRQCLFNSVLNVKALVGAFNQEKALVGAFSVIVKTLPMVRLQLQK